MIGPRAKVRLHNHRWARATVLDNQGDHGPSRLLVDGCYPARLVEPADWTFVLRCTFNRIGTHRDVAPLTVEARSGERLAELVYRYARPRLHSSDVDVAVNLDQMRGLILVGLFRPGGSFTIEAIEPDIEVSRAG